MGIRIRTKSGRYRRPVEPSKKEKRHSVQVGSTFWPDRNAYVNAMEKSVAAIMRQKNVSRTKAQQMFHQAIGVGPKKGGSFEIILTEADARKLRMSAPPEPKKGLRVVKASTAKGPIRPSAKLTPALKKRANIFVKTKRKKGA